MWPTATAAPATGSADRWWTNVQVMSNTKYARDRMLRLDAAETGVLARAVMNGIETITEAMASMTPGSEVHQALSRETQSLRSLLERLSD
jgi:hypothetical protein